jgi:hypothetical protein
VLPDQPPPRFQFSLTHLLVFMTVCIVLATGIHYLMRVLPTPPAGLAIAEPVFWSLGIAALVYFFIRVPFLGLSAARTASRWQEIQRHKRELATWARQQKPAPPDNDSDPASPTG